VQIEQRSFADVVLEQWCHGRRVLGGKGRQALEVLARIDDDARRLGVDEVTQHALRQRKLLVEQSRRCGRRRLRPDVAPQLAQVLDVLRQFGFGRALGHRADDEAARLVAGYQASELLAQRLAIGLALDPLRDADMLVLRQIDQHAAGQRHLGRQACPLAAHRILDDLHENALAFAQQALDRSQRFVARPRFADVGDMEKGGPAEADVDEGGLHPGQDADDPSEVDVTDEATTGAAFDVQFLDHTLVRDGDARFLGCEVDQDFF